MAFDDPLDRVPATEVQISQINDANIDCPIGMEIQWEIAPGVNRHYGEFLVLTAYTDGTLTAFIYEQEEEEREARE